MSISFEVDGEAGIVYTTLRDGSTIEDILSEVVSLVEGPSFRPGMNGIVDFRASDFSATPDDVRRIVRLLTELKDRILPSRSAIVVSSDLDFGMARMFQGLSTATGIETRVFRSMDRAKEWVAGPAQV